MSSERGTYNRRNWKNRWILRIAQSAKERREKLSSRYQVGNWKMYVKDEPETKAIILDPSSTTSRIAAKNKVDSVKKIGLFKKIKNIFK